MKIKQCAVLAVLGLSAVAAYSADNTIRVAAAHINVNSESPNLTSNGPDFLTPQPAGLKVGDSSTILVGYTRKLDAHWDVDFLLGIPPKHSILGTGKLAPFGEIATIKQAATALVLNYNFGAEGALLRPYVGLGVNFTNFFARQSTASGNIATGGPTKISLTNSTGLVGQAGVNYQFSKEWALCFSIATAKVETDMTTSTGNIQRKTSVNLRPTLMAVGLSYGF